MRGRMVSRKYFASATCRGCEVDPDARDAVGSETGSRRRAERIWLTVSELMRSRLASEASESESTALSVGPGGDVWVLKRELLDSACEVREGRNKDRK